MAMLLWSVFLAAGLSASDDRVGGFSVPAQPLPWTAPGRTDEPPDSLEHCLDGDSFGSGLADCAGIISEVIGTELVQCGLSFADPYQPDLPYPQVPADRAILGAQGDLLAYSRVEYHCPGVITVFKNPDGGHRHSIEVSENRLRFITPFQGGVARVSRWKSVDGYHYAYTCLGQPVPDVQSFRQCVQEAFIDLISSQLCRFGN